jgi:hypothetical protein
MRADHLPFGNWDCFQLVAHPRLRRDRYIVFYVCAHRQGGLNCSRVRDHPARVLAGWRPDGSGRAEWRDAGFSPRRKGTDLSLPQPDYPLTLTSLSPGERVSRLYRDG